MSINKDSAMLTWTIDSLFSGELICAQNRKGYRFSVDPVLLSHFIDINKDDNILDLGAGCGIMQLILLYRYSKIIGQITGIEIQEQLCALAEHNLKANKFEKKAKLVRGNVKAIDDYFLPESFNKIICNPPFYGKEAGRLSDNEQAKIARHEIKASLPDFIKAGAYCLKNRGCAYFIYPAEKIADFLNTAAKARLEAKKIQFIYSYPGDEVKANMVLVKCVKNGRKGVEVLSPFYIYSEKNGSYSFNMQKYYESN